MSDKPVPQIEWHAWVTGASQGIGRASALSLAVRGVALAITARNVSALEELRDEALGLGAPEVLVMPASVQDPEEVKSVAEQIRKDWGKLSIAVCAAGISGAMTRSAELSEEDWQAVIDTNLSGTFRTCQAAAQLMIDGGAIVNISSIHGAVAGPRIAAYAASKGGIDSLTRTLAVEWADGNIRVVAVSPGYIETPMTAALRESDRHRNRLLDSIPANRFGTADEIGDLVAFIAMDLPYMTGSVVTIDGGWTAQ